MTAERLIACHECDLLQREAPLTGESMLRCCRCGAELYRNHPDTLDRPLAFTLTAIVLFVIGNAFPIVGLSVNGDLVETTLLGAVRVLYRDGMWPIAGLGSLTTFLTPLIHLPPPPHLPVPLSLP